MDCVRGDRVLCVQRCRDNTLTGQGTLMKDPGLNAYVTSRDHQGPPLTVLGV